MNDAVTEVVLPAAGSGFSLLSLFFQAHIVVKVVIIGLLLASVWSWAIICDTTLRFRRVR